MKKFISVDEYIDSFPPEVAIRLQQLRLIIKKAAPKAVEKIGYNMPAYDQNGNLVYFGGFSNHISLFPHGVATELFKDELKDFVTSKGTIQFQHNQKLPATLIKKIVRYRIEENEKKKKSKKNIKSRASYL